MKRRRLQSRSLYQRYSCCASARRVFICGGAVRGGGAGAGGRGGGRAAACAHLGRGDGTQGGSPMGFVGALPRVARNRVRPTLSRPDPADRLAGVGRAHLPLGVPLRPHARGDHTEAAEAAPRRVGGGQGGGAEAASPPKRSSALCAPWPSCSRRRMPRRRCSTRRSARRRVAKRPAPSRSASSDRQCSSEVFTGSSRVHCRRRRGSSTGSARRPPQSRYVYIYPFPPYVTPHSPHISADILFFH